MNKNDDALAAPLANALLANATDALRKLPGVAALTKERKTRDDAIQTLAELLKKATPDFE
jgi:hypothetical protein